LLTVVFLSFSIQTLIFCVFESAFILCNKRLFCVCVMFLQHIVFSVKFLIAAFIPDVPADVKLAIKRVHIEQICV